MDATKEGEVSKEPEVKEEVKLGPVEEEENKIKNWSNSKSKLLFYSEGLL